MSSECPESTRPKNGMLSSKGILMSGIHRLLVISPVVDAIAVPSVMSVMTLQRKSVPPLPIILIAIPTRMMSVFNWKAKKPITRLITTPVTTAATSPGNQCPA